MRQVSYFEALHFVRNNCLQSASLVISISGYSCSGKSSFAEDVRKSLETWGKKVLLLPLDSYFLNADDYRLPRTAQGKKIWDAPDSYDSDLFVRHVNEASQGLAITIPNYDIATNTRLQEKKDSVSGKVILAEGLYADYFLRFRPEVVRVFLDTPHELCLARRIERDKRLYGVTEEQVTSLWESRIVPYCSSYMDLQRGNADMVVVERSCHG